jgi:hypothetical protein
VPWRAAADEMMRIYYGEGLEQTWGWLSHATLAFGWRCQAKLRMQFSKECIESTVKQCTANLQQVKCALCRPAPGLAFTHPLVYQVAQPRFGQGYYGCQPPPSA